MKEKQPISLWEETLAVLKEHGKDWDNVYWIGVKNFQIYKKDFEQWSKEIVYRPWMYGGNKIDVDLTLYGFDFILIRWEYDGSEGWSFRPNHPPLMYKMADSPEVLLQKY